WLPVSLLRGSWCPTAFPYTTLFRSFCTNPGVSVVLAGPESEELLAELRTLFEQTSPGPLLSQQGPKNIRESVAVLTLNGAECLRSEEHTSELQSRENLVCRLLLEKK